jgi:tetratricopeptide (TPR) repeat protein
LFSKNTAPQGAVFCYGDVIMPKMPVQPQSLSPLWLRATASKFIPPSSPKLNEAQRRQLLMMLQQGMELQRQSKFVDAERCYQMVLQRAPNMPEANNLMGTIAMEAEDFSVAVEFLEKAVTGSPRDPLIRHNIASALVSLHDFHAALTHLRKALDIKPGQVESLALMAMTYNRLSRSADGLPFAEKALRMDSANANARMAYSEALISLGRMEEAEIYLKETIAAQIAVPRSYQSLSSTRKYSTDAPELEAVRRETENTAYSEKELSPLHFAAAKMSNDAKLYDDAMAHYLKAKESSAAAYDIAAYERRIDELIALFNPMFLGARQSFGDPSQKPVFIVGMPRSGTTLTEQIISSHHQVAGAGELGEMSAIARSLGDHPKLHDRLAARLTTLTDIESKQVAQRYLKFIARTSHEAARITDKMPHNFELVGLIAILFPNATIIHCKRDAIDNCLSCYMNSFSEAHAYNTDLTKLGRYYCAYDKLMKHWQKVLPGRIFENQYETLVDDQKGQTRKMIAHCKLDWDEACLNYTENERSVTTISRWQVRQPIYKTSMKRWKPYEKHLGPLIAALGDLAEV